MSKEPTTPDEAIRKRHTLTQQRGFALIACISILSLCVMIALAMVSLAKTTNKAASNSELIEKARANARVALAMAVARLQEYSGPDTRVTAPADILVSGAPPLTGVWESWEGSNHSADGRPIKPNYGVKALDSTNSNSRFLGFLVSGAEGVTDPTSTALSSLVASSATSDTVPLLSTGTLRANKGQIHVEPVVFADESGAHAWWVSPENQKARVQQAFDARDASPAGYAEKWQSHAVPNLESLGLKSLQDTPEGFSPDGTSSARKAITLSTTGFMADGGAVLPQNRFHDISTSAVGLLTNTATGGWRKDLSILTEKWEDIYQVTGKDGEGRASQLGANVTLPLFRYTPTPGDTSAVPKATVAEKAPSSYTPDQSTFYPWTRHHKVFTEVRDGKTPPTWPNVFHAASTSWESLVKYATMYKSFTYSDGVAQSGFVWAPVMKLGWGVGDDSATASEFYDYNHMHRMHPITARFQFIIYAQAIPLPSDPSRYAMRLLYAPVVTMWNPYNVRLSIDIPGAPQWGVVVGGRRSFPGAFTIGDQSKNPDPTTIPNDQYKMLTSGNVQFMDLNGNYKRKHDDYLQDNIDLYNPGGSRVKTNIKLKTWGANLPNGELTFEPGEVRMFSPNGYSEMLWGGTAIGLLNGYKPSAPSGFPVELGGSMKDLSPTSRLWLHLKNEVYTKPFWFRDAGRGFNLSFGRNEGPGYTSKMNTLPGEIYSGVSQEMMSLTALTNNKRANVYWPQDDLEYHGYSVEEIASVPAMPLYSITIGPRSTIGLGVGTSQTRPTKGFVQADPLAGMSLVDPGEDDANSHPSNGNFEISYNTLSIGSTFTPNLSNREGFMGTGFQRGDGLTKLISHEVPLRPMASIMELQGWNPRGKNPMPPFQSHLVGNSDATPMIPKDGVVPTVLSSSSDENNLQHDDSYCANHLLMDDFFLSSIAPQPYSFGSLIAKDIDEVYTDFLKGDVFLTNRAYRPISADRGLSDAQVTARIAEIIDSGDGWQKIASRLEVEGMFNVNSTSVEAWKALLGHAKTAGDIPIYSDAGINTSPENNAKPHPITRSALGSDIEAGSDATAGDPVKNSELTGFRRLTDAQIQDLAEKIVDQVRLRGPFLSLSEFVNRQLSTNDDLAIAGAVQSAINNMREDPMRLVRDSGNFLSDETMASKADANPGGDDDDRLDGAGYEFPEAAEGSSTYGLPGWIRQADVLRPLAPILSARDDTFTIRAYGDARNENGVIVARAWCEATVTRKRDFVDPGDDADLTDAPTSKINQDYGRRYAVVSFRWLLPDEV